MPRDANGNYTLPAGNPVVSGTPISSNTHNSTNNDLATALTDSLSRTGLGGMLAPLFFADGAVGAPSISFTSEPTTGFYKEGPTELNVTVVGQKILSVKTDGLYNEQPYKQWNAGLAGYVNLLNAADNYNIQGTWSFVNLLTVNQGIIRQGKGRYTYHDDATLPSAAVFLSNSAPLPDNSQGSNGDFWYQLEP